MFSMSRSQVARILFSSALGIVLTAIILGFAAQSDPFLQQHHSLTTLTPHSIEKETIEGSPLWMVFERGMIYGDTSSIGDASSPLRRTFGDSIKWIDVTNPTPFLLALLLCGIGLILRTRLPTPEPESVCLHPPDSLTTCDRCKNTFASHLYLEKSQDGRYLCEECRAGLVV